MAAAGRSEDATQAAATGRLTLQRRRPAPCCGRAIEGPKLHRQPGLSPTDSPAVTPSLQLPPWTPAGEALASALEYCILCCMAWLPYVDGHDILRSGIGHRVDKAPCNATWRMPGIKTTTGGCWPGGLNPPLPAQGLPASAAGVLMRRRDSCRVRQQTQSRRQRRRCADAQLMSACEHPQVLTFVADTPCTPYTGLRRARWLLHSAGVTRSPV